MTSKMATAEGLTRLRRGSTALGDALLDLGVYGSSPRVHDKVRAAMPLLRSAMDWLEDTPHFDEAHRRLDVLGAAARAHFPQGCALTFRNGGYFQECPVALAHTRVGLSPGYIVRRAECGICGADPEHCPHIRGRTYDGAVCVRRLVELDLLEVSFVGRPAQPDARVMSVSVPTPKRRAARTAAAGDDGEHVRLCDMCTAPCEGVARPLEAGIRTEQRPPGGDPA